MHAVECLKRSLKKFNTFGSDDASISHMLGEGLQNVVVASNIPQGRAYRWLLQFQARVTLLTRWGRWD